MKRRLFPLTRFSVLALLIALCALTGLVLAQQRAGRQKDYNPKIRLPRVDTSEAQAALKPLCDTWMQVNKNAPSVKNAASVESINSTRRLCRTTGNNPSPYYKGYDCKIGSRTISHQCATTLDEVIFDGYSWCKSVEDFCVAAGGSFSTY